MSLLRMLPQSTCSFAILGLRRIGDELWLSRLTEELAMLGERRCDRCRCIRLLCSGRGLEWVSRTTSAGGWRVATELDGASALDDGNVVVFGEGIAVIMGRCAGTRVRCGIAVQATKEMGMVDGRCSRVAERSVGGSIDSLAAGAG